MISGGVISNRPARCARVPRRPHTHTAGRQSERRRRARQVFIRVAHPSRISESLSESPIRVVYALGPDLEHGGEGDGGGEVRRGEAEAGGDEDGVEVGVLSVRIVVK